MASDGSLGFTSSWVGQAQHFSLNFQALPWLDTSFRYSRIVQGYYDRAFGVKVRLFRESSLLPDVSIGIRDILGTGIYSSEYLALGKHFGPFDLTAGMGWGRLADRAAINNPLGYLSSSFKDRNSAEVATNGVSGTTGTVNFNQFFRGQKVGVFGGISWQTPIEGLSAAAEYSPDRYSYEQQWNRATYVFKVRTPANFGLTYRFSDAAAITAGWYYGSTIGFTIGLSGDPTTSYPSALRVGPEVPPPVVRSDIQQQDAVTGLRVVRREVSDAAGGGPWVKVGAPADQPKLRLLQALHAGVPGVRDVSIEGKSVVVNAPLSPNPRQCALYAQIATETSVPMSSLAVADLEDPSGKTQVCAVKPDKAAPDQAQPNIQWVADNSELRDRLTKDLANQAIFLDAVLVNSTEAWVYYKNYRYNSEAEAAGRAIRVLMAALPPSVELIHLVPMKFGVPGQMITVVRSAMERTVRNGMGSGLLGEAILLAPAPLNTRTFDRAVSDTYPSLVWSLDPKLSQHVFDPDKPLQFLVYGDAPIMLQIARGLALSAEFTGTIWTDYSYDRPAGSSLPHVRTDLLQYLKHSKVGLSSLQVTYRSRLTPSVFTEVHAGILEDMFLGVGGQVLWRPQESRLTFGADLYQVWQRGYHRLFDTRDYRVLTGHVSVYYETPWKGINAAVHAGQYLAGDRGATFELSRRFESGVEIGAWATFTNVPYAVFGEGSFDKGISLHIPLQWGLPIYSQSSYNLHMSSLTRDGGQRLGGDDSLYEATRASSYGEIAGHIHEVAQP
jgi:hypothetical protein